MGRIDPDRDEGQEYHIEKYIGMQTGNIFL
jgi:hypothetical protein